MAKKRDSGRRVRGYEVLEDRTLLTGGAPSSGLLVLGPADYMSSLLYLPTVTVELYDGATSLGPTSSNSFVLDTGTNGIMAMKSATNEMAAQGFATQGAFVETGTAGNWEVGVSQPYRFDFAGTNGLPITLENTRILSDPSTDLSIYGGVVGMPAMVGRVTSLDFTGLWGLGENIDFSDSLPAGSGHRYSFSVDNRIPVNPLHQLISGDPPTYEQIPILTAVPNQNGNAVPANFAFDTGAQMSAISTRLAFALGLDANHNGSLDDEAERLQEIGGVGGNKTVPVLLLDKVQVPTDQGVGLTWTSVEVLVVDVPTPEGTPPLDGFFGADLLMSGWFNFSGTNGYIDQVHLDFTTMAQGSGKVYFDLDPAYDTGLSFILESWSLAEDTGVSATDRTTSDATPSLALTFSGIVQGTAADVTVTGPTGAIVPFDSISGWGTDTLTVTTGTPLTAQGEYTLALAGTIHDNTGLALAGAAGEVAHFTFDTQSPAATVQPAGTTNWSPVVFTVTFNEPVFDFTAASVVPGGTAGASQVEVAPVGTLGTGYRVSVSGMAVAGTVTMEIPPGAVHDIAGNANADPVAATADYDPSLLTSFTVALDETLDQFGDQIPTVQAYRDGDGARVALSIFDTGASVVTFSPDDQSFFSPPIPIKVPGGAAALGIGGWITGDVSQPGTIEADGFNAMTMTFDQDGFPVFDINMGPNAAVTSGIQTFVGTEESPDLVTITGTPVLEKSPEHPDGLAAKIEMRGAELDFSDLLPGLVLYMPDIQFVAPGTPPTVTPETTGPIYVRMGDLGIRNYDNPGDLLTESPSPVQEQVRVTANGREAGGGHFLFDTGAQLSVISSATAEALGLDLENPTLGTIEVGGVGGTVNVPGFVLDELDMPTADGGVLRLTTVPVYVLDVGDGLDGILGMNLLNTAASVVYDPFNPAGSMVGFTFYTDPDRGAGELGAVEVALLQQKGASFFTSAAAGRGIPGLPPSPAPAELQAVTPSTATVSEATVGTGAFTLSLEFSGDMNQLAPPIIALPGAASGTLSLDAGASGWTSSTVYVARYNLTDADQTVADLAVDVSGALDANGNSVASAHFPSVFSIDTAGPTVLSIVRYTPAEPRTNLPNLTYRVTFSENVQGVSTADFSLVDAAGTITGESITGVSASAGQTIDVSINSGASGDGELRLDVVLPGATVLDVAGNALAASYSTGQIYRVDRHDAPMGASGSVTTPEDTAYLFAQTDFGFSDPHDSPPDAFSRMKITTLPILGQLKLGGVAVQAGDFVAVADIVEGRLTFEPATGGNGIPYTSFTFQVEDDGGTANGAVNLSPDPATLTINVTPVNDAPVLDPIGDKTVDEGATLSFMVTASDVDLPPNGLNLSANLPAGASLTQTAAGTWLFSWTPAYEQAGFYRNVEFTVTDNSGAPNSTDSEPITIGVGEVWSLPAHGKYGNNVLLRRNGDDIELVNKGNVNQQVFKIRDGTVPRLTIRGRNESADALTLDYSLGSFTLSEGVVFDGGSGKGADTLTIKGTPGSDAFAIGAEAIVVNGVVHRTTGTEGLTLDGALGNDTYRISSLPTTATLIDRKGADLLDFFSAASGVSIDLSKSSGQAQRIFAPNGVLALKGTFENVIGSPQADFIKGNSSANEVRGGDGNDTIYGEAGNDTLYGELGNNVLLGGAGNDTLDVLLNADATGRNLLIGGLGADTLQGGPGEEILIGGASKYDTKIASLAAVMGEWTSEQAFEDRCSRLESGIPFGKKDKILLKRKSTILDDRAADKLFGEAGSDWFFNFPKDAVQDRDPEDDR